MERTHILSIIILHTYTVYNCLRHSIDFGLRNTSHVSVESGLS